MIKPFPLRIAKALDSICNNNLPGKAVPPHYQSKVKSILPTKRAPKGSSGKKEREKKSKQHAVETHNANASINQ